MEDELELDLSSEEEEKLQAKNRFQKLSEKVKTTAHEKDEALANVKTADEARLKAEKERDFFKGFSQVSSKYPDATAYQDKILEKVNSGYTVEDAALVVLNSEGKLGGSVQPIATRDNIAGGSASTSVSDTGEKDPGHMTREEMRNALLGAEKDGVNLFQKN